MSFFLFATLLDSPLRRRSSEELANKHPAQTSAPSTLKNRQRFWPVLHYLMALMTDISGQMALPLTTALLCWVRTARGWCSVTPSPTTPSNHQTERWLRQQEDPVIEKLLATCGEDKKSLGGVEGPGPFTLVHAQKRESECHRHRGELIQLRPGDAEQARRSFGASTSPQMPN